MKRSIIICVLFFLTFAVGCASTYYEVKTKDGKEFITKEEPEFSKNEQSYKFTDVKGNKWVINRENLSTMQKKTEGQ
jgi:hypothetical protein